MESRAGSTGAQRARVQHWLSNSSQQTETQDCAPNSLYCLDTIQTMGSQSDSASNVCKIPPSFSVGIPGTMWRLQVSYQAIIDGRKKTLSVKLTPDSAKVIGQLLLLAFYETSHV